MKYQWFLSLALVLAVAQCIAQPVSTKEKQAGASASGSALSAEAEKFKPWRPERVYKVTALELQTPASADLKLYAVGKDGEEIFRKMFEGATVFDNGTGANERYRIVPASGKLEGISVDYIGIKTRGNGFGVNSDKYTSSAHLYITNFKLAAPASGGTQCKGDLDADINYTGATAKKRAAARVMLTCDLLADYKPAPPPEEKPAKPAATKAKGKEK
ncbi:MAG: hypothetical protein K1X53_00365 [Candidatus Sumerlaeaceae bacterium]|nr:hypothetical protein [Candidatus Sumerlaeaceae bacterium]